MDVANLTISEERNIRKPYRNLSEAIWCPRSHVAENKFFLRDTGNPEMSVLFWPFSTMQEIQWSQQVPAANRRSWKEFRQRSDTDEVFRYLHRNESPFLSQ